MLNTGVIKSYVYVKIIRTLKLRIILYFCIYMVIFKEPTSGSPLESPAEALVSFHKCQVVALYPSHLQG